MDWKLLAEKKLIPPMRPDVGHFACAVRSHNIDFFFLCRARETLTPLMNWRKFSWKITHCEPSEERENLVRCPPK
jgi:hypothetical protein